MTNKTTLRDLIIESKEKTKKLVVLFHGYGDNAENFSSLVGEINSGLKDFSFFIPNAPSSLPNYPTGRQWFDLYPNGINFNQAGPQEKEIMKKDIVRSMNLIEEYINKICLKFNLSKKDCLLIGFSQGAMIAYEYGKYIDQIFGGCILLSGRILPSKNHITKNFVKTPLMVVHGDQDNILEPKYFFETCKILDNYGYQYEKYLNQDETHTISLKTINLIKKFIKKKL